MVVKKIIIKEAKSSNSDDIFYHYLEEFMLKGEVNR